jgi:FAD/FMN-containing dehydrogenase
MAELSESRKAFAAALQAAAERLPDVTAEQLRSEGVLLTAEQVPTKFKVSFGKTFTIDTPTWMRPRTADELARVVRFADGAKRPLKAIGSLCTWSPAARADDDGIALVTKGLDGVQEPEFELLRVPALPRPTGPALANAELRDQKHLIRVGAGSTLWALNEELARRNLGLKTLGGFGGERVGGACSTGTHGSSLFAGPICDFVRSLDVVWRGVKVRLEPKDGPTDPAKFAASAAHQGWLLWQDDDAFHTARIGYGTIGVAFSYLLEVGPLYYLEEKRVPVPLAQAREDMRAVVQRAPGHVYERAWSAEFYFNLFSKKPAEQLATKVTRTLVPKPATLKPRATVDDVVFRTLRFFGIDPGRFFSFFFNLVPSFVPTAMQATIKLLNETYVNRADHVYNMGSINLVGTLVLETAVPAENLEAYLDDAFALAKRLFEDGHKSLTSPIGVRFVPPSQATLAVQGTFWTDAAGQKRPATLWAMVNYTLTRGTRHSDALMRAFFDLGLKHSGRGHPGKYTFDSQAQWSERCDLPDVLALRAIADPNETFLNAWNRKLFGLETEGPHPASLRSAPLST